MELITGRWWNVGADKMYENIWAAVRRIDQEQSYRITRNLAYDRLYRGEQAKGLEGAEYTQESRSGARTKLNIVSSAIDTAISKMMRSQGRVVYSTDGANYSQQRRAKLMTKIVNGVMQDIKFFQKLRTALLNACIFDIGPIKFPEGDDYPVCENVFPNEIKVDDRESINGEPRVIHHVKPMSAEVLEAAYPGKADMIMKAKSSITNPFDAPRKYDDDMLDVCESYHLPSGPGMDDGKRVISLPTGTLEVFDWDRAFPFIFLRWGTLPRGFYGQGIASKLAGIQESIDEWMEVIDETAAKATGFVSVHRGSNISKAALTNAIYNIVEYDEVEPRFQIPPSVDGALLQLADWAWAKGYEVVGISQLSATGRKPAGLNSGAALREYQDIGSERLQTPAYAVDSAYVEAAQIIEDTLEAIHTRVGSISVRYGTGDVFEKIEWDKVRNDRKEFTVKVMPTSMLPATPAGKLAFVEQIIEYGMITKEQALQMLNMPDLESFTGSATAFQDYVDKQIDDALDPDEPIQPDLPAFWEDARLREALDRVEAAWHEAAQKGAPELNLQMLEDYMVDIKTRIREIQMEAMAMQTQMQQPEEPQLQQQELV